MHDRDEPVAIPPDVEDDVAIDSIRILKDVSTSKKLRHRTASTTLAHAMISSAASGYCAMTSARCLRVTICTPRL